MACKLVSCGGHVHWTSAQRRADCQKSRNLNVQMHSVQYGTAHIGHTRRT